MDQDKTLREHLRKLLDWEDAHVNFDTAVEGIPHAVRGVIPERLPHSPWQLIEHLRLTQLDILHFCRDSAYVQPPMEHYWPPTAMPPNDEAWEESIEAFRRDREALKELAVDNSMNLFARIPHGSGQTYLRELLLVADHNAYHVAQLVTVRRALGVWT
jgi:DinB superfamily